MTSFTSLAGSPLGLLPPTEQVPSTVVGKVRESVESVGQRHRSAYRLCNFVHDAVVIVVSQDGTVRFVKWHDGEVTYWDNVATSVLDV